jgi:acetyltransferase-like isoleucine patch superfamily enzyme
MKIGDNVHINTHTHIAGRGKIILEDNVNISSGAKIFSGAVIIPDRKKLVWNPMMKEDLSLSNIGTVIMKNNSTVFANCTVAPGVTLGVGSVLLSNSFLNKNIKDYEIFCGVPAAKIGIRTN